MIHPLTLKRLSGQGGDCLCNLVKVKVRLDNLDKVHRKEMGSIVPSVVTPPDFDFFVCRFFGRISRSQESRIFLDSTSTALNISALLLFLLHQQS